MNNSIADCGLRIKKLFFNPQSAIRNRKMMHWINKLGARLRAMWRSGAVHDEIDAELQFHIDMQTQEYIERGLSPDEARHKAEDSFGRMTRIKELSWDVRGGGWLETLWQDLRYGARMLWKHPGFSFVAVLTLALGIGANTAIFSIVNGVLLRPLPYPEPDHLLYIWGRNKSLGISQGYLSAFDVVDYRERSGSFEQIAAYTTVPVNLSHTGQPERLEGILVTTNFFQTLGVQPLLGRTFLAEEGSEGRDHVVMISYGLWQRQFGGDPNLIGRTLRLDRIDGNSFLVVGVMPAEFQFPQRTDVWMPFDFDPEETHGGGGRDWRVIARLKPGRDVRQAQAEINTISQRLAEQYPATNAGWDLMLVAFPEYIFGNTRTALLMLLAAVGFVLLIVCTNVANLQLARAVSRQKELAVRTALGAGRLRIVRQLLTEYLLLATLGGALGLLIAEWSLYLLHGFGPDSIPRLSEVSINTKVLGFTVALSLLSGLLFGLAPALQVSKIDLNEALKEGGKSATTSSRHNRLRSVLVVSQVALALVLLIGAGLMIKSFLRLLEVNPGFKTENLLTLGISLTRADYPQDDPRRTAFFQQVIQRIQGLPGVTSVGAVSHLPLGGRGVNMSFAVEGGPPINSAEELNADLRVISPGYFEAMKIPLIKGRPFIEDDTALTQKVIINESFARRFFPNSDPMGKYLKISGSFFAGEIVGLIGDVKHRGLEAEARPEMYISYLQNTLWPVMNLVIRTSIDPSALRSTVRDEIQRVDKDQPVFNIKTMDQLLSESVAQRRFSMLLLGSFAALALVLAAAGIYGVMFYLISQRTHEIGIRLALGARSVDVLRLVLGQGLRLILIGVAIGVVAAFALTHVLSTLLYGVKATDPATFAGISLLLTVVALIACYIPARKAMKVDPVVALRYE
jgi:putative ABC transport system permease protein